jgi:hypothetical protein
MAETVNIRDLFLAKQETLVAALTETRSVIPHAGEKGTASELRWLNMLSELPRRYLARKGFVIDCNGRMSDQIDVIIHDTQYSPLLFESESTCFVPAESVYAVFDVKQTITKHEIEYAADKAASVRALHRTSAPVYHLGGISEGRPPGEINAGILALESEWSPPFGDSFRKTLAGLTGDRALQIGCALRHGAFECYRDDENELRIHVSPADVALMSFFLGLLQLLQRMGTAPALDLSAYGAALVTGNDEAGSAHA